MKIAVICLSVYACVCMHVDVHRQQNTVLFFFSFLTDRQVIHLKIEKFAPVVKVFIYRERNPCFYINMQIDIPNKNSKERYK